MRRPSLALLACLGAAAAGGGADAQSLMRLFGVDQPRRQPVPTRHRAVPRQPHPSVPLPVPRPHFAGDSAPRAAAIVPPPDVKKPDVSSTQAPAEPKAVDPTIAEPKTAETPHAGPRVTGDATPPLPPEKPADLASPAPAATAPPHPERAVAPSGATTSFTPRQPQEDAACFDRLKVRNVTFEPIAIGPQPDARCTVVQPVKLSSLTLPDGGTVAFPDHPTIACTTADAFSAYVHDLMAPLAKGSFGSPLTAVWTGPGLECRSRDHIFGAKLSAHGQGLAIDIAQIKLGDGRQIEVGLPKSEADTAFETAARAGGCGYFHTVLGPGSDSYHRTHWHFDLEVRGKTGDSKYCK